MQLITKVRNQPQQLTQWLLIVLVVIIFFQTYNRSWINTQKSSPFIANYAPAMSIAISELKYGSDRGLGYLMVYNLFTPLFRWGIDWGPEFSIVNKVINQAVNLDNVVTEGTFYTNYEALSIFYKLAFLLFGFKAESVFYLYWLLLALSTFIFLITFYNRPILLLYLLLFYCALFAVSQTQGVLLESIIRNRYFPILTILPAFYLILLIADEDRPNWIMLLGAVSQALILALIIYVRPSSLYQLIFLVGMTTILVILWWKNRKPLMVHAVQLWPLAIVLISYALIRVYTLNAGLPSTIVKRNCTWHMYYIGVAGNPKAYEKYGIIGSDGYVYDLVARKAPEYGYNMPVKGMDSLMISSLAHSSEEGLDYCGVVYEEIVKNEFIELFKQDPWLVINSYPYKIYEYFRLYFHPLAREFIAEIYNEPSTADFSQNYYGFGVIDQLVDWPVFITLILGIFLVGSVSLRGWFLPFILFLLQFLSALIIPVLYRPFNNTIVDSALSLTVVLLAIYCGIVYYGLHLIERYWSESKLLKFVYVGLMILLPVIILRGAVGYQPFNPKVDGISTSETQFYRQPADQVFPMYKGFNIILYEDKYYALARLGQVDMTSESALNECLTYEQCIVDNSPEEVRQMIDQLLPELIEVNYKGFYIVTYRNNFYALSQTLEFPPAQHLAPVLLRDDSFLRNCQASGQCVIGNSLEEAKQGVNALTKDF